MSIIFFKSSIDASMRVLWSRGNIGSSNEGRIGVVSVTEGKISLIFSRLCIASTANNWGMKS